MAKVGYRVKCLAQKINACNVCGTTDDLLVHHVNGERSDNRLENLVPLCRECHGKVHAASSPEGVIEDLQSRLPSSSLCFTPSESEHSQFRVSNEFADELFDRKQRGESYEDVIWRLIEEADGEDWLVQVELLEATPEPERTICTAARNDYMSEWVGDRSFEVIMAEIDGETLEEKKRTLIGHLLDHGHFGPFEHVQATFAVEGVSRSCMAQLTRHRHATFDVQSMRYVAFDDVDPAEVEEGAMVVTPPSATDPDWIGRNQQGGTVDDETVEQREQVFRRSARESVESYQELLDLGMPPEDARFVLPIGTEVNLVVSLNARMLMHVGDMRAAADSQWEIRELTEKILNLAAEWCPVMFEHYDEHMKDRKNRLAP